MKFKPALAKELSSYAEKGELDKAIGLLVRLNKDELAECKALTWLGAGRENPKHWDALVIEAKAKMDDETARLLAEDKNLAHDLTRGLERMEEAGRV
ncbi:MAG TPA: DUF3775 domain-containing protein [Gammaproteobacteria bacterium]|nr:DUF3775 domain-containing protein [Gammaproteobacteria bacterium]